MVKRDKPRVIGDVIRWSSRCREHFFPWRQTAKDLLEANSLAEAGITECHPGYDLERSCPRFHLLVYPTVGTGTAFDANREVCVSPGEVLIAPATKAFGYFPRD
ncbi:MAG: hypothetical protein NTZ09_09015, partial [Candidatus Hydrogenedentes bacterium]|nr:hypothetical protein [Candidatus Hydrogenedentota bacterium]